MNSEKTKELLLSRLQKLGAKVEEWEEDLRAPKSTGWEDRATEIEGDEVLDALEESAIAEISEIREALKRLDEGNYGVCGICDRKIDSRRMDVLPYATECVECAEQA